MGVAAATLGASWRVVCRTPPVWLPILLIPRLALGFPATDAATPSIVPAPSESTPSESDLRHQLQMHSAFGGFQSGAGGRNAGGWTIVPSVNLQEMFTDNVYQTSINRRWDLATLISPGIAVLGDTPNARVNLNYSPQVTWYARTPAQSGVSQQLLADGQFTIIPELFYVDARAVSGVGANQAGFGALGSGVNATPGSVGTVGLAKQNQVQTSSMSISPYVMHRFGDFGTGKIGYSFRQSSYSNVGSILPVFFPTGSNSQHSTTSEEVAQFLTGERFAPFRDLLLVDVSQTSGNTVGAGSQQILSNRLGYMVSRSVTVFGEVGAENLRFSGVPPTRINDAIWGFGTTLNPNADSRITLGYGHKNGVTGVQADASYALTARTQIGLRYSTGLQSDLQAIEGQLDLADLDSTGNAVDSQTGAPLFIGNSGFGAQSGLFRTKSLSLTASTVLDRDQFSLSIQLVQQTTIANAVPGTFTPSAFAAPVTPVGSTSQSKIGAFSWVHQFREDLTMTTGVSYSVGNFPGTGTVQSVGVSAALQYVISDTVAANMRYAFFDRSAAGPGQSLYQNLIIVGISKQF